MFFIKVKKHVFSVFYLQSNVLTSVIDAAYIVTMMITVMTTMMLTNGHSNEAAENAMKKF